MLDGRSLSHRIPWTRGEAFGSVCNRYVNYVLKKYGEAMVVLFYGYSNGPVSKM